MASRKLIVEVVGDTRNLDRTFGNASKSAKTFQANITGVSNGIQRLALAAGAAIGVRAVFNQLDAAVDAASNLSEQLNKARVVFRDSGDEIEAWSQTTAKAFGISQRAALEAAGAFGQLFETSGLTPQKAADMSRALVELASDIASFNNIDPGDALDKLRSGLAGEAEPLRRVGVLLSEARVKTEAYRAGIAKAGSKLTEAQKVLARYNLILKDTATAQGDFARTSGGLANQQRILGAQVENLQAKLGATLLPAVLRITKGLTEWLSNTQNQERVQRDFASAVKLVGTAANALVDVVRTLAPELKKMSDAVGGAKNAIKLLIAAMVVSKVVAFSKALGVLGNTAGASATKVALLRASLLRLGAIAAIVIPIEIVLHRQEIEKKVDELLDKLHVGFLKGKTINIPVSTDVRGLTAQRNAMAKLRGENDLMVKALDKAIAKLKELQHVTTGESGPRGALPEAASHLRKQVEAAVESATDISKPKGLTAAQRNQFFDAALARAIDRVQDSDLRGQITKLQNIARTIQQRINITKDITRKLNLEDKLLEVQRRLKATRLDLTEQLQEAAQRRADAAREAAEKRLAAVRAKQFKALGLTSEGAEPIPGVRGLRKQLERLDDAVGGTFLDTDKTKSLLGRIRKVLSGGLGAVSKDVRETIARMLAAIDNQLKEHGNRKLTKTTSINADSILGRLGLDRDTRKKLTARLSRFNSAGVGIASTPGTVGAFGVPVAAGGVTLKAPDVFLDGRKVSSNGRRHNTIHARSNPAQRRGRRR